MSPGKSRNFEFKNELFIKSFLKTPDVAKPSFLKTFGVMFLDTKVHPFLEWTVAVQWRGWGNGSKPHGRVSHRPLCRKGCLPCLGDPEVGKALPRTQRRTGGPAEALEGMWGQIQSTSPNSHGGRWRVHTRGDLPILTRRSSSGSPATGSGPTVPPAPVPNPTPHTFTPVTSNTGVNCTGPLAREGFPINTMKYCKCISPALQFLNSIFFGFLHCKNTHVYNTWNTPA